MKRIISRENIAFIIFLLLIGLFITYLFYKDLIYEKKIFQDSIIIQLYGNKAIVKNEIVSIDENSVSIKPYNKDNTVMIPLDFFMKYIGQQSIYEKKDGNIKIKFNDKELYCKNNSDISISIDNGKKVYTYPSFPAEIKDSTIYFPLSLLADFFGKAVHNSKDTVIIDNEEKLKTIEKYIVKKKGFLDNISKKFKENDNGAINIHKEQTLVDLGNYNWLKNGRLVAHACGGIDNYMYTNSYDSFIYNYNKGHRIFEVDLIMTSDKQLVARHDWYLDNYFEFNQNIPLKLNTIKNIRVKSTLLDNKRVIIPMSKSDFKSRSIYNSYKPLDYIDIAKLLEKYQDTYIITDVKGTTKEEIESTFKYLVNETKVVNTRILDRIIPQIYNEEMLSYVNNIHKFPSYIYALYQYQDIDERKIIDFAKQNGIRVIAIEEERYTDTFKEKLQSEDMFVYMHTINSPQAISYYINNGVYGFYTDFITPDKIEHNMNFI